MQYKLLMALSKLVCLLPHGALLAIGKVLGHLYYCLISKQRELAIRQMMQSLGISRSEAEHIVKASFVNLAQNVLEILYMPRLNKENFSKYIKIDHPEHLTDSLAKGHGVVILTGHIGTWEWLAAGLVFLGMPVTAIAKPQPNMQYTNVLNDLRATCGVEIFSRGTSELLAAARALRKGKILGFLADQDGGPAGAFVEFFGRTASTPMGPAVFSRKFKSPVVPTFILRQPDGGHLIHVLPPMELHDTGDPDRDLIEDTADMTHIIEDIIRQNPTQWLWFQHRWNTPPDEKTVHHHVTAREGKADGKKG